MGRSVFSKNNDCSDRRVSGKDFLNQYTFLMGQICPYTGQKMRQKLGDSPSIFSVAVLEGGDVSFGSKQSGSWLTLFL